MVAMVGVAEPVVSKDGNGEESQKKRIYNVNLTRNKAAVDPESTLQRSESPLQQQMRQLNMIDNHTGNQVKVDDDQVRRSHSQGQSEAQSSTSNAQSLALLENSAPESQSRPTDQPDSGHGERIPPFDALLAAKNAFPRAAFFAGLRMVRDQIETEMNPTPFKRQAFVRLPPKEYIFDLGQTVVEDTQLFCPTVTRGQFSRLLDAQYAAGPANSDDHPARFAIINALFGAAVRWRTANDSFDEMSAISWGFYKNAYAVFPELIVGGGDVSACEALLAMATFLLGTADTRTTTQLASAAARTSQILGLHVRETYANLDAADSERRKRVYWASYILNTDVMVKHGGLPSPHYLGGMIEFPTESFAVGDDPAARPLDFFPSMARLSVIQMRIHRQFSPHNLQLRSGGDHHVVVMACDGELDEWRSSLPEDLQPDYTALLATRELETPVALLHLVYFNALIKTHIGLAQVKNASRLHPLSPFYTSWLSSESLPLIEQSYAKCVSAARATIDLFRVMSPQPYVHLRAIICYPVMATLILLWASLEEPMGPHAQLNVRMMGQYVQFLAGVKEEGPDVQNVLDGCSKLYKVAKYAVYPQRTIRLLRPLEEDPDVRDQFEALRLKLSDVTDWMHLAQGLLGNMPTLVAQARDVLADVLGMEQQDGEYGMFAPNVLKPQSFN
ncbi:Fusaridione A cluster transcription factor fsdR, partial [Colletotrichum shisoi]